MKEKILQLRSEGKTYNEICKILGCNKSTISYHCGVGQKEKFQKRQQDRRKDKVLDVKIERFKCRDLSEKARSFQRREQGKLIPRKEYNFTIDDLIKKVGDKPICYLSGKPINIKDGKSYHLDHIIPAAKGGNNSLENAGILDATVNKMKHDLTVEQFINICKEILEYQGFIVNKKED